MKLFALVLAIALVGTGGAAAAADCTLTITTFGNMGTTSFTNGMIVDAGNNESCAVTNSLAVPAFHYGVFKADSQGYAILADGESAEITLTRGSDAQGVVVDGAHDDPVEWTKYYATGFVVVGTSFSATAAIDMTGASTLGSIGEYDVVDLLMGYTTLDSQETSLDEIGLEQLGIVTHLDVTAGLLTGSNQPLEGEDEIGVIGGVGSYTLGVTGRYNLAEGFSVLGGASIVNFGVPGASASGLLGAAAVRFVQPGGDDVRLYGEAGVQVAALGLSFSRHYDNGTVSNYEATGSGDGWFGSLYAKGGVLWAPDADNSVLFSATLKQGALGIGSLVENDPDGSPNLFSADLSGTSQTFTTVKGGADWTTMLATDLDLTASLAVGAAFGSGASGDVFGVGTVTGAPQSTLFAEYGLRLGWDLSPMSRVDGFVAGSTGTGIGSHTQIGAAYHLKF